jgi:peptidyl-prolyl cis-trans isomerase C
MSKLHNGVLLAGLTVLMTLTACTEKGADQQAPAASAAPAVAMVNGKPLSKDLFDAYSRQRSAARPMADSPENRKAAIEELVSRELIYQDALKKGIDKDPEVVADFENLQRNILANLALRKHLETNPTSDEAMQKEYAATLGKMGSTEYKARHILVKTEQEAKDIIAQLGKGADFAKLAKEKSLDGSASSGGDLGWFNQSGMVKPFFDAVSALKKGKYSKTPTQSEFGWHVILLEDTRPFTPPKFEEVKDRIRDMLTTEQVKGYIDQLKAQATVDIPEAADAGAAAAPTPDTAPQ